MIAWLRTPASRGLLAGCLLVLLNGCGEPDAPAPERSAEPAATLPFELPAAEPARQDEAHYDELRARWLELEHAARPPAAAADAIPEPAAEPVEPAPIPVTDPGATPAIGIIIDDVGHHLSRGRRLIALPVPVALAILPHTQSADALAAEAAAAGRIVMLHQPMENGAALPIGPGGLYSDMERAELERTLRANLDSIAGIRGLNNHMGSRLTSDRQAMDWVMPLLAQRGLFFVDSRTSAATQAAFAAEAAGVRHLSRDVFLDNDRSAAGLEAAFQRALVLARQRGTALVIGHPYPETLAYLERRLPDLQRQEGVEVVSVEELLARKYR